MPIVTICNHKGGTGKTTTVMHIAAALGHSGRRVLVVDFDPQGFLSKMLGVDEPSPQHSSLALLDPNASLRGMPTLEMSGFDLLPASYALTKAQRTLTKPTDVFWVKETVQQGHDYDIVIFDTAAALSVYTMNALVASEYCLIPVTPEYQPVVGAEQTWQTARLVREKLNPALDQPLMLLTQVDGRKRDHAAYSAYLRKTYGSAVLNNVVRTCASLAETSHDGRTAFDHEPNSRGSQDYRDATEELLRHYGSNIGGQQVEERVSSVMSSTELRPPVMPVAAPTQPQVSLDPAPVLRGPFAAPLPPELPKPTTGEQEEPEEVPNPQQWVPLHRLS